MNYSYADKYLLSLTLRRDGSSRFGKNHRYATFPSVSLGWRITQESFMKELTWLDDLKLRASWGQTGNQEISNLARYTIYAPNYGTTDSFGGQSYGRQHIGTCHADLLLAGCNLLFQQVQFWTGGRLR